MPQPPFTDFSGILSGAKVAIVTTGGVHTTGQERFDIDDPLGDCSYREIPSDTLPEDLTWTHYYHAPDRGKDLEEIFPLATILRLADAGRVGAVNHRHFSFMGAIHDAGELIDRTAPGVASKLRDDGVDAVLLTPSCPLCHRSVALISSEVERSGIPTVAISMQDGTDAPRVARVPFGYNSPMGESRGMPESVRRRLFEEVALEALGLLETLREPGEVSIPADGF